MSKKFRNLGYCFLVVSNFSSCPKNVKNFSSSSFFSHVQKTSIHQFSLPSSTISPYFNSSYYSFFTFFTLYSILFNISQKKFLLRPNGGGFNPQTPTLPTPLGLNEIG